MSSMITIDVFEQMFFNKKTFVTNLYYVTSKSIITDIDDDGFCRINRNMVSDIFKDLKSYLESLEINYGILMKLDYSIVVTSEPIEVDNLIWKLSCGWEIIDPSKNATLRKRSINELQDINSFLESK